MSLEELRDFLRSRPSGTVADENDQSEIGRLLANAWAELDITDRTSMTIEKIVRIEQLVCDYPLLRFKIERHGAMAFNSKRAEMVSWVIDLETGLARSEVTGFRQKVPSARRLNVQPLVESTVESVLAGKSDTHLKWSGKDQVRILIETIISSEGVPKQTVAGRRKRFRSRLAKRLAPLGWREERTNVFVRTE